MSEQKTLKQPSVEGFAKQLHNHAIWLRIKGDGTSSELWRERDIQQAVKEWLEAKHNANLLRWQNAHTNHKSFYSGKTNEDKELLEDLEK